LANDYKVNLKAEIQQIQIELLEELGHKRGD
jgi:hypothetical protein